MSQEACPRPEVPLDLEIETARLVLRAPHPDYAEKVNEAIRESFDELRAWMDWARQVPSIDESRAQQERARKQFLDREELPLLLFCGDRVVGGSGLHRIDWSLPAFEIGYWVRRSETGRGYVTEAVEAIGDFAVQQLGARRVEIRTDTRNSQSRKIPERLGYDLEGILRHDRLDTQGLPRNTAVYAKTR